MIVFKDKLQVQFIYIKIDLNKFLTNTIKTT